MHGLFLWKPLRGLFNITDVVWFIIYTVFVFFPNGRRVIFPHFALIHRFFVIFQNMSFRRSLFGT